MIKKFLILTGFFFCLTGISMAHHHFDIPTKESVKQECKMDEYLDSRLHFTPEQKSYIKHNRQKYKKDMEKIVKQMQDCHDRIFEVYMLGLPRYQTDIRTAADKAMLVVLKQNAKRTKESHIKAFEAILSNEQKIEFQKIRKEFAANRKSSLYKPR